MKASSCRIYTIFLSSILFTFLFTHLSQAKSSVDSAKIISNKLIKIETRQNVTQKFILIKPENPVATVILLDGPGDFKMGTFFGKPTIGKMEKGTLIRTREIFAKYGFMVAVMDKPSDYKPPPNSPVGIPQFRMSSEHVQDINAVISYLKKEVDVPVYLVGMCMGTFSVARAGINIKKGIDGLIFLSAMTKIPNGPLAMSNPNGIIDLDLGTINLPTLIVYNKDDECDNTPPSRANEIKKALKNSPVVEVRMLGGGKAPLPGPCQAMSYHGYYGIEEQLVSTIADFIKSNLK